jgi:small conductance mechanosensitive channel
MLSVLAQARLTPEEIEACGPPEDASAACRVIFRWTENELLASLSDTLVVKPATALLIVVLAFIINRSIHRLIKRFVAGMRGERVRSRLRAVREIAPGSVVQPNSVHGLRAAQRADTIGALLRSIASFVVWTIAVLMVLGEIGIQLGPLIAGAGIAGIALGFGAQNMVKDFLSGIFMLIEDQYGVGDIIDAGPATGTVEAVSLRTTRLRDVQGVVWHVPNGLIERVGNMSQQWSRALLDIEVAYETDLDTASEVIRQTAVNMWREEKWAELILEEPEVWGVETLGADGVAIRLVVKTRPLEQWKTARELRSRIKRAFDEVGIEIPFPQRTVWHRADAGSVRVELDEPSGSG